MGPGLIVIVTIALELVMVVALAAAAGIAIGFGGAYYVGPWAVSATSARNPLAIAATALTIRSFFTSTAFLGVFPIASLPVRALRMVRRLHARLEHLTPARARTFVLAVMLLSLAVKLALAWAHPGFWTGDDVEIHEMTFARLFDYHVPIWNLRSPFYPLGVIYPFQAAAVRVGIDDPAQLVFVGRAVVAVCTIGTLWLTFHVAARVLGSVPAAVLSVLLLGLNQLHVKTGTTELPRPVASLCVLAAFGLLSSSARPVAGGAAASLIGMAAAMRYSEELFVVPAMAQLFIARRWLQLLVFVAAFAATVAIIFGPVEAVYWGEPFFSIRHIVDYTLVQGLSSRGYQPWYYYLRAVPDWTNVVTLALAVYATIAVRMWMLAAWAWTPLIALSLLPHKEPRYLVPMLPFY